MATINNTNQALQGQVDIANQLSALLQEQNKMLEERTRELTRQAEISAALSRSISDISDGASNIDD